MHSQALSPFPARPAAPPPGSSDAPADGALKAVLWDMDGTLVDTEPYWIAAERTLVEAHGGAWTPEQAMSLVGQSLVYSSKVLQQSGVSMDSRAIINHLTVEVIGQVRKAVPWRPGARELLHQLFEQGVRCALVTMSEGPLAAEIVDSLPERYFEFMITGDAVTHGKPHPEPYLTAVERLRLEDASLTADNCVALEDSVPGVASAQASGVVTVAIPHVVPLPEHPGRATWRTLVGRTVNDLRALTAARVAADGSAARTTAEGTRARAAEGSAAQVAAEGPAA